MQHNQAEVKRIIDHSMLTRSIIESEVAMRKCQMYSQMAQDKEVKAFFHKQANALDSVSEYFQSKLGDVI